MHGEDSRLTRTMSLIIRHVAKITASRRSGRVRERTLRQPIPQTKPVRLPETLGENIFCYSP
jgi:hypothetical protein